MKLRLTLLTAVLGASTLSAQIPVGSIYTGGSVKIGFDSYNSGETKNTTFQLMPYALYQINDHWAAGGGLSISSETDKEEDNDYKSTTTSYGLGPAVRYYQSISMAVMCYLQGGIGFSFGSTKTEFDGNEQPKVNNSSFGLGVRPGIAWRIKDRVYLDFSYGNLSYTSTTSKQEDSDDKNTSSEFCLSLNPKHITMGLYYTFGPSAE